MQHAQLGLPVRAAEQLHVRRRRAARARRRRAAPRARSGGSHCTCASRDRARAHVLAVLWACGEGEEATECKDGGEGEHTEVDEAEERLVLMEVG